jgi:hypothetical protein
LANITYLKLTNKFLLSKQNLGIRLTALSSSSAIKGEYEKEMRKSWHIDCDKHERWFSDLLFLREAYKEAERQTKRIIKPCQSVE